MPKKVLPSAQAFGVFEKELRIRGFRPVSSGEFKRDWVRLELEAPSPRTGREVGFSFSANGLTTVVWTTFLRREGQAREQDAGWVLIKDGDEVLYCSHPIHRTQNFLDTLLMQAKKARYRVKNRPLCPQCGALMNITKGRALKSRFWRCTKPAMHKRPVSIPWDHGLPKEALDFDKRRKKLRAQYQAKLRREGLRSGRAIKRRIGWKITRRDNFIPAR